VPDLVDRLVVAIDAKESKARAASKGPWLLDDFGDGKAVVLGPDGEGVIASYVDTRLEHGEALGTLLTVENAAHIADNDPDTVLRRCAADRQILKSHLPGRTEWNLDSDGDHDFGCSTCHYDMDCQVVVNNGWCPTLLSLAAGYGVTEDGG